MRRLALALASACVPCLAGAAGLTVRVEHAIVSHDGITEDYARAIARTAAAARAAAIEQFGFDMPQTIHVDVRREPGAAVRLFNDGDDRLFLTIRSERDLQPPSQSGIFHIYGLCHEVAHLALYRPVRDRGWLTTAAAEGWAHYLGSRLVDAVHGREGKGLWPDRYDYLADGMARLERELATGRGAPTTRGARAWIALERIVGDRGFAPIFAAWGKARIDPTDPGPAAREALLAAAPDKPVGDWWKKAEPLLLLRRPKSGFAARTASPGALTGRPTELAHDDGTPAGKKSMAGSGHAVRFKVNGDGWYLAAVSVHGSRYGLPQPPREEFHVWLCDADLKPIAHFAFPYAKFAPGAPKWVALDVKPTEVPGAFTVCVGFNPTATRGVYVHHDAEPGGNSVVGLPGGTGQPFSQGDWLIRVKVDRLKAGDALRRNE